jgi:hypothetical protein
MPPKGKRQAEHFNYFLDVMRTLEWDLHQTVISHGRVPWAWHQIAKTRGAQPKVKVTMGIEEDVVKFFRLMGKGYQVRMNDVLRAYMHGRIAELIDGPDAKDTAAALGAELERPRMGNTVLSRMGIVRNGDGTLTDLEEMALIESEDGT